MKDGQNRRRLISTLASLSLSATGLFTLTLLGAPGNLAFAQGAPKLEDSVIFTTPGGPAQDVLNKCTIDAFSKKNNVRVDILSIQPQMALTRVLAQRNTESIDLMWSLAATDYQGYKEGVFLPVTSKDVPNLANIDPKFTAEPHDGALLTTAIQGMVYNTKVFAEKGWAAPTSWRDLWDPKFKGHVAINDLSITSGQGLFAVAGMLKGGKSDNYDAAFDYMKELKPNLYTIFSQVPQFDSAMLNGQTWIGMTSNGRALGEKQEGGPVSFVQPSEGDIIGNVYLPIVKGAPHPKAALAFVDWMLSKDAQTCLPSAGYSPIVKGVQVPADLAPFMTVERNVIPVDWVKMQQNLPALLKRWQAEVQG